MAFRFCVSGEVREAESNRPLLDCVVRAYDHDVVKDDFLGEARTDADGWFSIVFTEQAFRDVGESRPDLYLKVFDAEGKRLLASTRSELRRNARNEERFEIRVPRATLDGRSL
jgi:carotenoid cleavage dioxygenase